jgi:hypothetical protein
VLMYDSAGGKIGTLQRNVKRKPLTAADRIRISREFGQIMDSVPPVIRQQMKFEPEMSDSLPAISELAAGDSLLLVRRGSFVSQDPAPAANQSRWDILGWDNSYRGFVDLPSSLSISGIRNGRLYAVACAGRAAKTLIAGRSNQDSRTFIRRELHSGFIESLRTTVRRHASIADRTSTLPALHHPAL